MSQTIEPFPEPALEDPLSRRILLALLLALALHAALLLLPLSLDRELPRRNPPIRITIVQPPKPEVVPAPAKTIEPAAATTEPPAATPAKPASPSKPTKPKPSPATPKPTAEVEKQPAPVQSAGDTRPPPAETGAKSRSTVFDPGLAKKLARERNKVRRFESEDARYRTATGTFVQQGDRCWEVVQLVGDTSTESSQWLRRKCPGTSRSGADIDRLARKYGIP